MPLVIKEKDISIGAYKVVGRKLPQLCIQNGEKLEFFGEFNSDEKAEKFMRQLAQMMGIENVNAE